MPRIAALLPAAAAALLLSSGIHAGAHAESLSCQTVNGQTMCMRGSGSMSCQTVNGQTVCQQGSGSLTCQTVNKRTVCSTDPKGAPKGDLGPEAMPQLPPDLKGSLDQDVTVEQDGGKLRVRAGGVDVRIE